MKMCVVVTGCRGSVGKFISDSLHGLGYKVVGFEVFSQSCLLKMVANFETLFLFSSHRQKLNLITYRVVCLCNGGVAGDPLKNDLI